MNENKSLDEAIKALPNDIAPERDLWAGIEKAIVEQPAKKTPWQLYGSAAAVMLVAVLGWFSWQQQAITNDWLADLTADHENRKQALLVKYQGNEPVVENWQQQLDELDKAATVIKDALKEDPNNAALVLMLEQIYQQQLTLIEKVHGPKWQNI